MNILLLVFKVFLDPIKSQKVDLLEGMDSTQIFSDVIHGRPRYVNFSVYKKMRLFFYGMMTIFCLLGSTYKFVEKD